MIFGHSHTRCLRVANLHESSKELGADFSVPIYGRRGIHGSIVVTTVLNKKIANPIITKQIEIHLDQSKGRPLWLASIVEGNLANRMGMIKASDPFDFYHPLLPDSEISSDSTLLSYDLVKETMYEHLSQLQDFYRLIPKSDIAGIIHIEGPPPVYDNQFIKEQLTDRSPQLLRRLQNFGDANKSIEISEKISEIEINPFDFRKKMWLMQCDITREICEEEGIIYFPPPESVFCERGGLAKRFQHDNAHGNTQYGLEILSYLDSYISKEGTP